MATPPPKKSFISMTKGLVKTAIKQIKDEDDKQSSKNPALIDNYTTDNDTNYTTLLNKINNYLKKKKINLYDKIIHTDYSTQISDNYLLNNLLNIFENYDNSDDAFLDLELYTYNELKKLTKSYYDLYEAFYDMKKIDSLNKLFNNDSNFDKLSEYIISKQTGGNIYKKKGGGMNISNTLGTITTQTLKGTSLITAYLTKAAVSPITVPIRELQNVKNISDAKSILNILLELDNKHIIELICIIYYYFIYNIYLVNKLILYINKNDTADNKKSKIKLENNLFKFFDLFNKILKIISNIISSNNFSYKNKDFYYIFDYDNITPNKKIIKINKFNLKNFLDIINELKNNEDTIDALQQTFKSIQSKYSKNTTSSIDNMSSSNNDNMSSSNNDNMSSLSKEKMTTSSGENNEIDNAIKKLSVMYLTYMIVSIYNEPKKELQKQKYIIFNNYLEVIINYIGLDKSFYKDFKYTSSNTDRKLSDFSKLFNNIYSDYDTDDFKTFNTEIASDTHEEEKNLEQSKKDTKKNTQTDTQTDTQKEDKDALALVPTETEGDKLYKKIKGTNNSKPNSITSYETEIENMIHEFGNISNLSSYNTFTTNKNNKLSKEAVSVINETNMTDINNKLLDLQSSMTIDDLNKLINIIFSNNSEYLRSEPLKVIINSIEHYPLQFIINLDKGLLNTLFNNNNINNIKEDFFKNDTFKNKLDCNLFEFIDETRLKNIGFKYISDKKSECIKTIPIETINKIKDKDIMYILKFMSEEQLKDIDESSLKTIIDKNLNDKLISTDVIKIIQSNFITNINDIFKECKYEFIKYLLTNIDTTLIDFSKIETENIMKFNKIINKDIINKDIINKLNKTQINDLIKKLIKNNSPSIIITNLNTTNLNTDLIYDASKLNYSTHILSYIFENIDIDTFKNINKDCFNLIFFGESNPTAPTDPYNINNYTKLIKTDKKDILKDSITIIYDIIEKRGGDYKNYVSDTTNNGPDPKYIIM
jgi:hypothetical protein